jgi:type III secretory pathway component EscR
MAPNSQQFHSQRTATDWQAGQRDSVFAVLASPTLVGLDLALSTGLLVLLVAVALDSVVSTVSSQPPPDWSLKIVFEEVK